MKLNIKPQPLYFIVYGDYADRDEPSDIFEYARSITHWNELNPIQKFWVLTMCVDIKQRYESSSLKPGAYKMWITWTKVHIRKIRF